MSGAQSHRQPGEPTQVDQAAGFWGRGELQTGKRLEQIAQGGGALDPRQRSPEAGVNSGGECQVVAGVGPGDIEGVGIGETSGSRLAPPKSRTTMSPAAMVWPATSMSHNAVRAVI